MRLYSMRMLTLVSLIASFALSSQAQDNRTMHPDAYSNGPYAGHARVLRDGGAAGRPRQRSVHPQDEGRRGMLRTLALASVNREHHDGQWHSAHGNQEREARAVVGGEFSIGSATTCHEFCLRPRVHSFCVHRRAVRYSLCGRRRQRDHVRRSFEKEVGSITVVRSDHLTLNSTQNGGWPTFLSGDHHN